MEDYGKNCTIRVGPWGGQDGLIWDDGVYSTIRQLEVTHGAGVDSIRIEYDMKGNSVWSEKHGGIGGTKTDKIKLEYPHEYLTSIHGHYGSLNEWGPIFIRSLTFESNKRTYGPYGIEHGTQFSFPMIGGKICGFHGKVGWYLDAIGAHLEPIHKPSNSNSMVQYCPSSYAVNENENFGYSVMQGSFGKNFDIILAVRHRDDFRSSIPDNLLKQTSSSRDQFNIAEPKNKILGVPPGIERYPSRHIQGVLTYGPWGGTGGTVFDDGIYDGVRQIKLSRNVGIVSVRVCYERNGQTVWGSKNGGTGGFKSDKIVFDFPSEILTHISGYHGPTMVMGPNIIRSLTFHTNKAKYGPFGEEQGHQFSTDLREGMVVGFHGRKGLFVDAIGVHVIEGKVLSSISSPSTSFNKHSVHATEGKVIPAISSPSASFNKHETPANESENRQWSFIPGKRGLTEEVIQRVVKDPAPYGTGPWGGVGGRPWDDGVFTGIKQIILTCSEAICSMEIEYDRNGQSVWSVKHGGTGTGGQTAHRVKLEYPHEVITCTSGYYGPISKYGGVEVIKSLTFHTSRTKYGPFGEEVGTSFTSGTTEGKVVGFHGRSGMYLDAVGVHMQHWLGNQKVKKPSSLMKIFS